MPFRHADSQELERLEESLWRAKTRFDSDHMQRVLAPEFFEFGRSGRSYGRTEAIAAAPFAIDATLPLKGFAAHHLRDDIALVAYVSEVRREGELQLANRSSIWMRTSAGWQLRFHQGTPTGG